MEVSSGIVFRRIPCFSAAGVDNHCSSSKLSYLIPGVSIDAGNRVSKKFFNSPPRKISGFSSSAFSDNEHLNYYHAPPRCGIKKEKEKRMGEIKTTKKKLKLLKGLSNDFSMFSQMGLGVDPCNGLVGEVQGKIITVQEAADVLLSQLQKLRAEEKELKRKKKLEKAQLKATAMIESQSSESSDSECGEVIQMSRLRKEAVAEPTVHELLAVAGTQQESTSTHLPISLAQEANATSTSCRNAVCDDESSLVTTSASAKRIEVCMGGKCKKSGAAQLLEEFERVIGMEGNVVGCKCMGKCRDGPNVKVLNGIEAEAVDDSVRTPTNPLCIGVGLADVGVILANFFGEDGGLAPAV